MTRDSVAANDSLTNIHCGLASPEQETRIFGQVVVREEPLYNVVLLDDDDHTYEYVIEMLVKIFGHAVADAYGMAVEVDTTGRVIADSTHLERAELKRDQIMNFGCDPLLRSSHGSMRATIEPQQG